MKNKETIQKFKIKVYTNQNLQRFTIKHLVSKNNLICILLHIFLCYNCIVLHNLGIRC
nr:MAG TPA: hypothetical protein [Caudoviricetes sp.]